MVCNGGLGSLPFNRYCVTRGHLAFNVKDLCRKAMMPLAQFGKAWAVTFRFKLFP